MFGHVVGLAVPRAADGMTTATACDVITTTRGWPRRPLEAVVGWWDAAPVSAIH
jgi:hypothetical protein